MIYRTLTVALAITAALGCNPMRVPEYHASAKILTRPSDPADRGEIVIIPSELKLLQAMADSVVTGASHRVAVEHFADTDLIGVFVTTTDPRQAAALCNEIAERFVAAAGEGDIERQLIEKATPPKRPIR